MSPPAPFTHFTLISRFLGTKWQWFFICICKNKVREIFTLVVAWEIIGNNSKQLKESFLQQTNTFAISNHDGKITVNGPLDFEKVQRYTLFVTAKVFTKIQLLYFTFFLKKIENLQHWKTALEGIRLFTDYPIRFSNQNSTEIKSSTRAK